MAPTKSKKLDDSSRDTCLELSSHITKQREREKNVIKARPSNENGHKTCDFQCCCRELADQVKRIEGDIKLLKNGVKTHEANETLQCCMGACKNEETRLRDYLEAANATIKDLTAKVQNLESEKSSLLTTIKIIQEDNSQRTNNMHTEKDPHKNPWVEVNNKKKKRKQNAKQKERQNEPPIRSDAEKLVAKTNVDMRQETRSAPPKTVGPSDQTKNDENLDLEGSHPGTKPTRVIVAGDSMVKHVNGYKMSTKSTKIQVSAFPGSTTLDMTDYIKPILRKKPDKLIIHVGTNCLKSRENSERCAEEIIKLGESVKKSIPETEVAISSLITRSDDEFLTRKVSDVNKVLKQTCIQKHWKYIDHTNITPEDLNQSRIHLNKVGTIKMARNFTDFIYNRKH